MHYASQWKGFVMAVLASIVLVPCVGFAAQVNINKADVTVIAKELKGVGPAKAKAIVTYREKNGAFKNVNDLLKVKGISTKVLEQNRNTIVITDGT